jgi:general secretion pathway protein C
MRKAARRLIGAPAKRLRRVTIFSAMELLLLSLLAFQAARLFWTIVTPVSPIGEWRTNVAAPSASVSAPSLGDFDPFFRLAGQSGPAEVTSLNLELFGVREDRATGRGSAIISTPDGQQQSFSVGDQIIPGVVLTSVSSDHVTISRNGASEQIFLDQSQPVEAAPQPAPPAPAPPAPEEAAPPAAEAPR